MALVKITPVEARVRWDARKAAPSSVRIGDRLLTVRALDAVRDETAAFPAGSGPRTTYVLATDAGQAALVYDRRRRRWFVEALDSAA